MAWLADFLKETGEAGKKALELAMEGSEVPLYRMKISNLKSYEVLKVWRTNAQGAQLIGRVRETGELLVAIYFKTPDLQIIISRIVRAKKVIEVRDRYGEVEIVPPGNIPEVSLNDEVVIVERCSLAGCTQKIVIQPQQS